MNQLKTNSSHELVTFFACRNPVDHLISLFGHCLDKWHKWKENGKLKVKKRFYSWQKFLRIVTDKKVDYLKQCDKENSTYTCNHIQHYLQKGKKTEQTFIKDMHWVTQI